MGHKRLIFIQDEAKRWITLGIARVRKLYKWTIWHNEVKYVPKYENNQNHNSLTTINVWLYRAIQTNMSNLTVNLRSIPILNKAELVEAVSKESGYN